MFANLPLAGPMLNVRKGMGLELAFAFQNILEILILDVDQSAWQIPIVLTTKPVLGINVWILALEFVVKEQSAEFKIMSLL